jgi:two-component system chemotaxis response regulator CheB
MSLAVRPFAAQRAGPAVAPFRVMVCDDSLTVRAAVCRILESDPAITIIGRAGNGAEAVRLVPTLKPEVLILDIEMPVLDGIAALPQLLKADPQLKIVMASTLTTRGADVAMQALRAGASDYVPKPTSAAAILAEGSGAEPGFRHELLAKVKGLGALRRRSVAPGAFTAERNAKAAAGGTAPPPAHAAHAPATPFTLARAGNAGPPRVLAVGSSTGGPQALFALFGGLPKGFPLPVLVTQHMPKTFTPILADHISKLGGMPCAEAVDGETLKPGHAYLAPGDCHMLVEPRKNALVVRLSDSPPENFCRPAVDPMLRSLVAALGGRVLAVVLTGMGHDGLAGARALVGAGGQVLAQDEATSVVWGMPGAVAQAGLAMAVLPLPRLPAKIIELIGTRA